MCIGKTAFMCRFADKTYAGDNNVTTIGIDFKYEMLEINGKRIKLQIWDTAGQEQFRSVIATYYRGADGVIVMFDLTSKKSFYNVQKWLKEVEENCAKDPCRVLVGNKCDNKSQRDVSHDDITKFLGQNSIQIFESSTKEDINVEEVFQYLTEMILKSKNEYEERNIQLEVQVENKKALKKSKNKTRKCCIQ